MGSSALYFGFYLFLVLCINHSSFGSGSSKSSVSCIESEREALLEFKQDLRDPSNRLASWVDGTDCCKWSGIICDNVTGQVYKLLLRGPNNPPSETYDDISFNEFNAYKRTLLGGKVNPSLVELKHLRHLDLSSNDFGVTPIPAFFGSLRSLRYLNLSHSKFRGVIPHQLGNLTHLRVLDLGYHLDGYAKNLQWLSHLSSLRFLDMSYVNLSQASDWLQVTNSLPSLTVLRLSSCQLNFNVPPLYDHVNFSSLAILDLSFNYFWRFSSSPQSIPKWVSNLRSLASLDLSQTTNGSPIPEGIQNMTSLVHLDLSFNYFSTSSIPSWFYKMSRLKFLHLGYNSLGGTISSHITNLTSIIMLDLSYNHFEGKLPKSMGTQLCNLKEIHLPFNKWNQSISQVLDSLSGCVSSNLEFLDIVDGQIYGQLTNQIGQFNKLTHLDLAFNTISGPIPVSLGNLLSLRYLGLRLNHFNETLPESFGQLAKLEYLDISSNNFMEGVVSEAHFANSTRLRSLDAGGTPLTLDVHPSWVPPFQLVLLYMNSWHLGPSFPLWLRSQENLSMLDLSNTSLEDVVPSWIWDSFVFSYLDLSHNQMKGRIKKLSKISTWDSVTFDLSHNRFEGSLPSISSNVVGLDLSNNMFSGSISQFLCNRPSEQMNMEFLRLQNNQLSGAISNCWSTKWKNLIILNLSYNKFSRTIPSSLGSLVLLQSLHLRNNNLSGELPLYLRNCTELITLDLGGNKLRGRIPIWIGTRLLNLKILSLRLNKFHGQIPDQLCALSALQILDVAYNNLSGYIPKCVSNFSFMAVGDDSSYFFYTLNGTDTSFEEDALLVMKGQEFEYSRNLDLVSSIDLSGNFLSGHIPTEITNLANLVSLNLSNNLLTGEIPHGMGKMGSLESVDFSMNKLSGEIPPSMSNLSFLSHLNLSYNKLRGRIPLGTQLQSFDASSFIGNSLCGPPLTQNCSGDGVTPTVEKKTGNEDDDDDDSGMSGFYIGMGVGFAIGFWGVCVSLFFNRAWRHNYFRFLDRMKDSIYVASSLKARWFREKLGNYFHNQ